METMHRRSSLQSPLLKTGFSNTGIVCPVICSIPDARLLLELIKFVVLPVGEFDKRIPSDTSITFGKANGLNPRNPSIVAGAQEEHDHGFDLRCKSENV